MAIKQSVFVKKAFWGGLMVILFAACVSRRQQTAWVQHFQKGGWIKTGWDSAMQQLPFVDSATLTTMRYVNSKQQYYLLSLYYRHAEGEQCGGQLVMLPAEDSTFVISGHKYIRYFLCTPAYAADSIIRGKHRKVNITATHLQITDSAGRWVRFE